MTEINQKVQHLVKSSLWTHNTPYFATSWKAYLYKTETEIDNKAQLLHQINESMFISSVPTIDVTMKRELQMAQGGPF